MKPPLSAPPSTASAPKLSGLWGDVDLTTAESLVSNRPIKIQRTMLSKPYDVTAGDSVIVTLEYADKHGRSYGSDVTPAFVVTRPMRVDSITRFEVIDEFGVDIGIGLVLGQSKQESP